MKKESFVPRKTYLSCQKCGTRAHSRLRKFIFGGYWSLWARDRCIGIEEKKIKESNNGIKQNEKDEGLFGRTVVRRRGT